MNSSVSLCLMGSGVLFFEGLPGSGKSISSANLASALAGGGFDIELFQETTPGHPLRVGEVDEVGAAMADIHLRYSAADFASAALDRYREFISNRRSSQISIFESFPIQSHVRVLMQMDAPGEAIWEFWTDIQSALDPVSPALVFLRDTDAVPALTETMEKRGDEWSRYIVEALEQTPYAVARQLKGVPGVLQMLGEYGALMDEAIARWRFPTLVLDARPANFDVRDEMVSNWVKTLL